MKDSEALFGEVRLLITYRLDQLDAHVNKLQSQIQLSQVELLKEVKEVENKVVLVKIDLSRLQARAGTWGAVGGAVSGAALALLVAWLVK